MSDQQVIPLRPKLDEARGPVVLCGQCFRSRVRWDWRKDRQLCEDCTPREAA